MASKTGAATTETCKALAADIGPMKELNSDVEFEQSRPLQTWLSSNNILFRAKKNVNDLAILDSNLGHIKKQTAKDLQQNNTDDWAARLPKVLKGHNRNAHQSLLNETPARCSTRRARRPQMQTRSSRCVNRQAGRWQHNTT